MRKKTHANNVNILIITNTLINITRYIMIITIYMITWEYKYDYLEYKFVRINSITYSVYMYRNIRVCVCVIIYSELGLHITYLLYIFKYIIYLYLHKLQTYSIQTTSGLFQD